jgi:hypothetical protein
MEVVMTDRQLKMMLSLSKELQDFLQTVKDEGTGIDAGTDFRSRDLWVTVGGVEWRINIQQVERRDADAA